MATIDLNRLNGDEVVVHYGGSFASVDAYTFANSIIALADAAGALSSTIDPDQEIEILIVALSDGSFRATLKRVKKGLGGFFARGAESLLWAYVALLLIEKSEPVNINVIVESDQVIVQHGKDRVIVPKSVWDHMPAVRKDARVEKNLSKTFEILNDDQAIKVFGLTPNIKDKVPLVAVPRSEFPRMSTQSSPVAAEAILSEQKKRFRTESVRLVILKAWLKQRNRKWAFEWNGIPISAVIADKAFWEKLSRRDILIGVGDALDVMLKYEQAYDENIATYVNNHNSFEIIDVLGHVGGASPGLPEL
jgi:hypothetical protein